MFPSPAVRYRADLAWANAVTIRKNFEFHRSVFAQLANLFHVILGENCVVMPRAKSGVIHGPSPLSHIAHVVGMCADKKMCRLNTCRGITRVTHMHPLGYLTAKKFKAGPVRSHDRVAVPKGTVARLQAVGRPQPALVRLGRRRSHVIDENFCGTEPRRTARKFTFARGLPAGNRNVRLNITELFQPVLMRGAQPAAVVFTSAVINRADTMGHVDSYLVGQAPARVQRVRGLNQVCQRPMTRA